MDGVHIGIFLKEPRPGRVKTRLARAVGAEAAAEVYTAMLGDTVTLAGGAGAAGQLLFYEGAPPESFLKRSLAPNASSVAQRGHGLGARLAAAMADASDLGHLPLLFLGSDSPDLPQEHLRGAMALLAECEVVLGPSTDGGAWCIGLNAAYPGFFDDLPWSSAETFDALWARAEELQLRVARAGPWSDVDELSDLVALNERLRQNSEAAPRCRAWLSENVDLLRQADRQV